MLDVLDSLHPLAGKLADEPLDSDEAAELVQLCVEAERVIAAMRMMAARAVDCDHWQARGFRSAAAWMAAEAGTPVGPAIAAMETLRLLDNLPATAAAFREGRLSLSQAIEMRRGLQLDHKGPYAGTHLTSIENAARLCKWHHYQKSHHGYTYRGGPGTWEWVPPDIPTRPDQSSRSTRC
jgi:hypothetical protein